MILIPRRARAPPRGWTPIEWEKRVADDEVTATARRGRENRARMRTRRCLSRSLEIMEVAELAAVTNCGIQGKTGMLKDAVV